jgi:hypothetical protein
MSSTGLHMSNAPIDVLSECWSRANQRRMSSSGIGCIDGAKYATLCGLGLSLGGKQDGQNSQARPPRPKTTPHANID